MRNLHRGAPPGAAPERRERWRGTVPRGHRAGSRRGPAQIQRSPADSDRSAGGRGPGFGESRRTEGGGPRRVRAAAARRRPQALALERVADVAEAHGTGWIEVECTAPERLVI